MIRRGACLLVLLCGAFAAHAQDWNAPEEPAGYRSQEYRAPVPATLRGARVLDPEQAHALWQAGTAAFVDVLPRPPKPANLPEGTIWREQVRKSVPGAIWLPNVGYGALADVMAEYFRAGLSKATEGDPDHPIVFFCLLDCWMSWNAAKRAMEYGYRDVYWFPDGTDGWAFHDFPLVPVAPEPGDQ